MMQVFYSACMTTETGLVYCGHQHPTIQDAMRCMYPNGGFVRAWENGEYRSLNDAEVHIFIIESKGRQ